MAERLLPFLGLCSMIGILIETSPVSPLPASNAVKWYSVDADTYAIVGSDAASSWSRADEQCRNLSYAFSSSVISSGRLAVISTAGEMNVLLSNLASLQLDVDILWIGGRLEMTPWRWSDGTTLGSFAPWDASSQTTSGPSDSSSWVSSAPTGDSSDCASLNVMSHSWYRRACTNKLPFVCRMNTPSSQNCTTSQYCDVFSPPEVDICFLICWSTYGSLTSGVTWYEASDYCHQIGAQLASLSVEDIQELLISRLNQEVRQVQECWIGLSRNQWIWSANGIQVPTTYWLRSSLTTGSGGKCLSIQWSGSGEALAGYWQARDCNSLLPFLCQFVYVSKTTTQIPSDDEKRSSLNVLLTSVATVDWASSPTTAKVQVQRTYDVGLVVGLTILALILGVLIAGLVFTFIKFVRRRKAMIEQSRNRHAEQRAADHYNRWKVPFAAENGGSQTVRNRQPEDLFVTSCSTTVDDVDSYVGGRWNERRISTDRMNSSPFQHETMSNDIDSATPSTVPLSVSRYELMAVDDRSARFGDYATPMSIQDDSGNGSVEEGRGTDRRSSYTNHKKESELNVSDEAEVLRQNSSSGIRAAVLHSKKTVDPTALDEVRTGESVVFQSLQQLRVPHLSADDGNRSVGPIARSASIDSTSGIGSPSHPFEMRRSSSFGGAPSAAAAEAQIRGTTVRTNASFDRRRARARRLSSSAHSPLVLRHPDLRLSTCASHPLQPHVGLSTIADDAAAKPSLFPISTTSVAPTASSSSFVDESTSMIDVRDSTASEHEVAKGMESTNHHLRGNNGDWPTSNEPSTAVATDGDELFFMRASALGGDDAGENRDVNSQNSRPRNAELQSASNDNERKQKIKIGRSHTDDERPHHHRRHRHHHHRQNNDTQRPSKDQESQQHCSKGSEEPHRSRGGYDDGHRTKDRSSKSVHSDRHDDDRRHRHARGHQRDDLHVDGSVEDDSNDSRHQGRQRRSRRRHRSSSKDRTRSSSSSRPRPEPLLSVEDWERAAEAEAAADAPISAQVARYNAGGQV